jgi:KDO2-lipid IV(A) lauroyltransferase
MRPWLSKIMIQPSLAGMAWVLNSFFALLPLDSASALGGWLGRQIGPQLRVTKNAELELTCVFPELNALEIKKIIDRMWDNLGRTAGEHPHLAQFDPYMKNSRVKIIGTKYIDQLRDDGLPGIFFSGHLANWELVPMASTKRNLPLHLIYRKANNPFFDRLVQKGRLNTGGQYFPKGAEGSKKILRALNQGDHLAMLVDQKMNDGIPIPFLGRDAMTAPALAQLALRYNCPIVPVQVERLKGAYFLVTVHPPLNLPKSDDKQANIAAIMTDVNKHIENWIRKQPEQWLWVHNRWPNYQESLPK